MYGLAMTGGPILITAAVGFGALVAGRVAQIKARRMKNKDTE